MDAQQTHILQIEGGSDIPHPQAGLIEIEFFGKAGEILSPPYRGTLQSAATPAYLYYSTTGRETRLSLTPPRDAESMAISLRPWKSSEITLRRQPTLYGVGGRAMTDKPVPRGVAKTGHAINALARATRNLLVAARRSVRRKRASWIVPFSCEGRQLYRLSAVLRVNGTHRHDAMLTVSFTDATGAPVLELPRGFSQSQFGAAYQYLRRGNTDELFNLRTIFRAPAHAKSGIARLTSASKSVVLHAELKPVVEPVIWSDLRSSAVEHMSYSETRALLSEARVLGDYEFAVTLARQLDALDGTEVSAISVRQLDGVAEELSANWLPATLSRRRQTRASEVVWSVGHLFKGLWPFESNGGAIRSWNIAKYQAQKGWPQLACLPVSQHDGPDRPDGVEVVARDGVDVATMSFSAFDRKKIPSPRLLDLEATLQADLIDSHGCNIVHAASGFKGFDNALKGLAISRHLNLPFVYEVRSFHEQSWA